MPIVDPQAALRNAQTRSKKLALKLFRNKDPVSGGSGGLFRAATRDTFLAFISKIPSMYILPKIHKDVFLGTNSWQGRPVLSCCQAPTRPVDWICTALLNPLLQLLPERLMDTTDFINKLAVFRDPIPSGGISLLTRRGIIVPQHSTKGSSNKSRGFLRHEQTQN